MHGREKGIGMRLDYIIVDRGSWHYVNSTRILDQIGGSDHCPVEIDINFNN